MAANGRSERRIQQIWDAEVSLSEKSVPKEKTVTENVSLHGACVTIVRPGKLRRWSLFYGLALGPKEGSLTASARRAATSPME